MLNENIQCIFCNKNSSQVVIEENGYKGRKCPSCGLIYISPRPIYSEIINLYSQDQAYISSESHISDSFNKRLYAKHNLRIIKKFIKNGSLLEIGAGAGYFLNEARKEGFEVYGIEFNKILANFIRTKLKIPCEGFPLDNSLFEGKKFDVIYHCDVLSHFYNPITEFQKIGDRLRDNGILVFETGNFGDVKEEYYKFIHRFQYPDHLFFFGENNLKELLRRTGFEYIEIYRYSILPQLQVIKVTELVKEYRYSVLPQFWIIKKLKKTRDFIKSKINFKSIGKNNTAKVEPYNIYSPKIEKFNFENIKIYLFYFIRYKIGYLISKKGRPQTIIIIAKKGF